MAPVPTAPTALKMVVAFMVVKSWSLCPLPFLLLFAVLFFLMVQLITFEAFLSSLVPLLFFFPAHSLRLVAASNSTARSHLSNFTCRAFCDLCRFLKQIIWESMFFSNCYLLAVSAILAQVDLIHIIISYLTRQNFVRLMYQVHTRLRQKSCLLRFWKTKINKFNVIDTYTY